MFTMNLSHFVCYLKDTFLDPPQPAKSWNEEGGIVKDGLLISLDLSLINYHVNPSLKKRTMVHFVLAGNCNVFVAMDNKTFDKVELSEFENLSNHDSCWRDAIDTYLTNIYFNWADKIKGDLAPKDLDANCYLGFFTHHKSAIVTIKPDPEDNLGYKKLLMKVEFPKNKES